MTSHRYTKPPLSALTHLHGAELVAASRNVISVFTHICFGGNETCLIFEMALDIFASLPIDSFSFIVLKNINKTSCL